MYYLALTLAFILELIAFAAFAGTGFLFPVSNPFQVTLAIILLAILIAFWSFFMSPRAPKKFPAKPYYLAKSVIYAISAFTLIQTYGLKAGVLFIVAVLVDEALLFRHNLS